MSSIIKKMGYGVLFTAISKYSGVIVSIIISAFLARLLSPDEFGVIAIVLVFVSFFNLLSDFGIGPAIIQNKELTTTDIRSIFSLTILFGLALSAFFFFLSPAIAFFYKLPVLSNVGRLLSVAIFFYSVSIVPNAMLLKAHKFKQVGLVAVGIQVITGSLAIFLAYLGYGYYSLVIKSICDGLFVFLAYFFLAPVKVIYPIDQSAIRKILRFSSYQFLFNFINYFARNADSLLIGKYFGSGPLAFYDKSYKLMMMPVQNLTHVITPVLLPVLSDYQNDKDRIFWQYLQITKLLAIIGVPLSVFLYYAAPEIIEIVYGPLWKESIPVFKLLSLTVGIQIVLSSSGSIFQAINRTDLLFLSGLLSSACMLLGICYGVFFAKNLEGIAYGLIVAFVINFFQAFFVLIHLAMGKSIIQFLKQFDLAILSGLIVFFVFKIVFPLSFAGLYVSFFLKIILALLIFCVSLLFVKDYKAILIRKFKK